MLNFISLVQIKRISTFVIRDLKITKYNTKGKCAIVSCHLFKQLQKKKIPARIWLAEADNIGGHCFITVKINNIDCVIDLTFTQFSLAGNCIILIEELNTYFKRISKILGNHVRVYDRDSLECFHDLIKNWPKEQIPTI